MFRYNQIKAQQTQTLNRKEEHMMNKKLTRALMATILALSVTTAVLAPTMTSVFAATAPVPADPPINQDQKPAPQPPANEPPTEGTDPHSGHH